MLDAVAAGELSFGGVVVQYRAVQAPSPQQPYSFGGYGFSDLSEPYRRSYRYWSCHDLTASGNSVHDLTHKAGGRFALDNSVRVCSIPYDGLDGLARFSVGSPEKLEPGRVCLFEVFAPLEAVILTEACSFEKGVLHYVLRAGSQQTAECAELRLFGLGVGPLPHSRVIKPVVGDWKRTGEYWEAEADLELADWRVVTLMLSVGPYAVHRLVLSDVAAHTGNPRIEAYRVFDADLEVLRDSMGKPGSVRSAQFDAAVARLLVFLGFGVTQLSGDARLGDAVDLLAHASVGNACLAVECTTGALGSGGKLTKLVARVGALRQAVPNIEVRGVLVTSLERSQVAQTDFDAAAGDGLAVICREDLQELLEIALTRPRVSEALGFLQTRVPPQRRPTPGVRSR